VILLLGVIVLGATNRRDDLDKALLRPGRFDVEVQVPVPDFAGRKEILLHYLSKVKLADDVDVELLARGTTGFTGADIENLVNQVITDIVSNVLCSLRSYTLL
jgi:ATP-dependent metalloprotease